MSSHKACNCFSWSPPKRRSSDGRGGREEDLESAEHQLTGLKSLDEFVEKWFNPIRMIGAEEGLISRSLTFIVIHEGPLFAEEPYAFVFLNTQPRNLEKVQKALLTIPEIVSADTVFGPYDVRCSIRARDREDLERVISIIHKNVPNIEGTVTTIVARIMV